MNEEIEKAIATIVTAQTGNSPLEVKLTQALCVVILSMQEDLKAMRAALERLSPPPRRSWPKPVDWDSLSDPNHPMNPAGWR